MAINRRRLNAALLGGVLSTPLVRAAWGASKGAGRFGHGVASGDPLGDRVILWTRVTPSAEVSAVPVRWRIARDPALKDIVNKGEMLALGARDYTVKVDALGLEPARTYYYQFDSGGEVSPIGRTRTLPVGVVQQLRFAVVSCSNLPFGYFNVYANIAARFDLDAVLHLGDYFYEYGPSGYGADIGKQLGREHFPSRELVSLADYRARHAQYKSDLDLQEAHRQHPWIAVWDDHESANDSNASGAQNHNPELGEGDWLTRKWAAMRAYAEWMPIRETFDDLDLTLYRRFAFGDLLDLIMLDTRLHGRDPQVKKDDLKALGRSDRTLLGFDQEAWLQRELRTSVQRGARYRFLGQQIMMGQLLDAERRVANTDAWDGYPAARQRLFDQLKAERIDNVVVLTGDIHSAWALDLAADPFAGYNAADGHGSLAVEMVATSVTSPGPFGVGEAAKKREEATLKGLPHIKWVNFLDRGYLLLDVTPERTQGEWLFVESVLTRGSPDRLGGMMAMAAGSNRLVAVTTASDQNTNRPALISS